MHAWGSLKFLLYPLGYYFKKDCCCALSVLVHCKGWSLMKVRIFAACTSSVNQVSCSQCDGWDAFLFLILPGRPGESKTRAKALKRSVCGTYSHNSIGEPQVTESINYCSVKNKQTGSIKCHYSSRQLSPQTLSVRTVNLPTHI